MPIYLDGHATTPLCPEARDAMLRAWSHTGNATSAHSAGSTAAVELERARTAVADLVGAAPPEIVFTSGATEANNLALFGVAEWARRTGCERRHIVVSAIEHKAVLEPARALASAGFRVDVLPAEISGGIDLCAADELITGDTLLVSVMTANNEVGTLQPVREIAALAHAAGALVHSDGAQAVGKVPLDVFDLEIDYLSISAHKMYGPMGVGALFVSASAARPAPLLVGGGQEGGLRSGTVPVPLAAGFGTAAEVARREMARDATLTHSLGQRFLHRLGERGVPFAQLCGGIGRLPGSLSLVIQDIDAEELARILSPDVQVSTGSACTTGQLDVSHVLRALGLSTAVARSVLRVCFGRYNGLKEPELAADMLAAAHSRLVATGGGPQ